MASAALSGIEAKLELSTDGGSTWTMPTELRDITFSLGGRFAEVTNRSTAIDGSNIPFVEQKKIAIDWSATFGANAIDAATMDTLNTHATTLSSLKARFTIKEASGYPRFTADCFVTMDYGSPTTDVSSVSVTLTSAGPIAVADQ